MNRQRLLALIRALPEALDEICLHAAVSGGYPGSIAHYCYADEYLALTDPEVGLAARNSAIKLGGFVDFL